MTKYVRTKDNSIYQVYDKVFEHKGDKRYQLVDSRFEISLNDIIKEAYTIQELCDGFWLESDRYDPVYIPTYIRLKERFDAFKNSDKKLGTNELSTKTFYGSIYIRGEGWLHIAKLNEKGELELL